MTTLPITTTQQAEGHWVAVFDDFQPGDLEGVGATEELAIANLLEDTAYQAQS